MSTALVIIALLALQRLGELVYAARNTRALRARGAVEIGRSHYPVMVLLHASWFASLVVFLPRPTSVHWAWIAVVVVLQALRLWVLASLGPYWTTRILTLPDVPLVRRGPYRFVRHPNYIVVAGEIASLPLAFGEVWVAVTFSILNACMLLWRIVVEDEALAVRRDGAPLPPAARPT